MENDDNATNTEQQQEEKVAESLSRIDIVAEPEGATSLPDNFPAIDDDDETLEEAPAELPDAAPEAKVCEAQGVAEEMPNPEVSVEQNPEEMAVTMSGVRKKSRPMPSYENDSVVVNGTKRKVRNNPPQIPTDNEYFHIWHASEGGGVAGEAVFDAPPLPPKNALSGNGLHRPLERSWPPRVPRHTKPSSEFSFDIIDTDEALLTLPTEVNITDQVNFVPGEFFSEHRQTATLKPGKFIDCDFAPLATPETDGSLSDRAVESNSGHQTPKLKPLMKKKIGPDNYISTILAKKVVEQVEKPLEPIDMEANGLALGEFLLFIDGILLF
ncbi:hypothetical protein DMENIID0001_060760 [Sergentomyia squamirostris]